MSEAAILWIFGTLVTINSGIVGVMFLMLWGHITQCRKDGETRAASLAILTTQQNRIMQDIGDHESGIRGNLHSLRNEISPMVIWVERQMVKQ